MRTTLHEGTPEPLAPGAAFARYEVIEHLRRGNDLDVYDAWSEERGTRCVIKALRPDRSRSRRGRAALIREGALLTELTHPHIVRAYETLLEPWPAIVLETLSGQTLAHMIDADGQPSASEVAHLGLHLGSALRYLHRNLILHLDLKPSNVIADAGRAKLIDLSIARAPGRCPAGVGTWHYLSPEQARGGTLTAAADVWGLGAVLFETASGEAPYDDDPDAWTGDGRPTDSEDASRDDSEPAEPVRYPQLERPPRRVGEVAPVEPGLAALIDACLQSEPAARPGLPAVLARLESIAGLPERERRFTQALAAHPPSR